MWPFKFNKRYSLAGSDVLQGLTDWHCHILPGVDDGVKTMEESLKALSSYEEMGIKEVWLTPHIMEDIPNTTENLRRAFVSLRASYNGPITLHLASENMLDNLFEERLRNNDLLPLGKDGRYLLVETSYFNPPYGLQNILLRIKAKGYVPVLAHPERYIYMDKENYKQLKNLNIAFQLNLPSMVGAYGQDSKHKAEWLLQNMYYSFYGTDTHSKYMWEEYANKKVINRDVLNML